MFLEIEKKQENKIALIDSDGLRMTYGDIKEFSTAFERSISGRTLIFIRCRNCVGAIAGFLSAVNNHIVPLLVNDSLNEELFDHLVETYHPSYIWKPESEKSDDDFIALSDYRYILVKCGYESYPLYDDLSLLLSTSGSTGSPKLVRHSYNNLDSQGKNISCFFGIKESDLAMADLPISYTMGLSVVISFLYAGATVLLTGMTVLDPEYWDFFRSNNATVLTNIPYTFEMLSKLRFFDMNLPSLRILSQGGGKLRENLFVQCAEYAEKQGIQFFATYGQTEGTARMAYLPPQVAKEKICSIGKAIPGGRLYLIDDNGNTINEPGTEGEMVYEGPNVTLGYAQSPEELSLGDERNGILYTGDMAQMDNEGFFYIVGRKSRFLKLNGVRVSLDECENLIKRQFGCNCACVGDDNRMGIYVEKNPDIKQIKDYITSATGLNSIFFSVESIDRIPVNQSGKILYKELEKQYGNS